MYEDRTDAALALIPFLKKYEGQNGIVLAIPRGGVPIAYPIARVLRFPLDILLTKKIGHPNQKELAIGAVSLQARVLSRKLTVSAAYIDAETARIQLLLREMYTRYRGAKAPADSTGKVIIVVDDGIATGQTLLATIELLRSQRPARLVVAVPVGPPEAVRRIGREVDELICPLVPDNFQAVGQFYRNFSQTSDEEVIALLQKADDRSAPD
ncbi:phosphoribosyltransferase [Nibrella saemangeumensis]|uniref:Phosphoribosyltransferase n=1 Tax=Nibrella saemangeumensis TaxID=1084526 RepID=A0ABP8NJY4_9BACT